jgi:hypothetical protein
MQIFYLHHDPKIAAQQMCDAHILSSCKEVLQIISTVWRVTCPIIYDQYHRKDILIRPWVVAEHPVIQWTMASEESYLWVLTFFTACLEEFEFRRKKKHVYHAKLEELVRLGVPPVPKGFVYMSQQYQAVGQYKNDDPVVAYREFYQKEKRDFAKWRWGRDAPDWWQ